eukprot:1629948-Pleurochrysis_carterae.AAC.5
MMFVYGCTSSPGVDFRPLSCDKSARPCRCFLLRASAQDLTTSQSGASLSCCALASDSLILGSVHRCECKCKMLSKYPASKCNAKTLRWPFTFKRTESSSQNGWLWISHAFGFSFVDIM